MPVPASSTATPRWRSATTLAVGAAAFALVAVRAVTLSMTYDEAATYLRYIQNDPGLIFRFDVATNHFLNTALVRLLYAIGGRHDFLLRLPNVVAFALFLVWTSQLLRRVSTPAIAVATFAMVAANPYTLDFFSLSRGYGLGVALLTGSLAAALDALEGGGAPSLRRLAWRGWAAVLANFSTLYAVLTIVAIGWIADAMAARRAARVAPNPRRRGLFAFLAIVVAAFITLVVMHDVEVAGDAYVPIAVRVSGLEANALDQVAMAELDDHDRPTPLVRGATGDTWRQPRPSGPVSLRVDLPAATAATVTLEVSIGGTTFTTSTSTSTSWHVVDADRDGVRRLESGPSIALTRSRVPRYGGPINWRGDEYFLRQVAAAVVIPIAWWCVFALALAGAGRLLEGARLATSDGWRVIALALLAIAGFSGEPLYLLNLRHQLYYGGVVGIVSDTVGSLVDGTLYDATYAGALRPWLMDGVGIVLALFACAAIAAIVRRERRALIPAAVVFAVMACSASASLLARHLTQAPLPLGRTALFFLPLFTALTGFTLDLIARTALAARSVAAAASVAFAVLALLHLSRVISLESTHEWKRDAQVRQVIADVERVAAADDPHRRRAVLGVDRFYSASTTYYALGTSHPAIDVVVEPWPCDYLYVADPHDGSVPNVLAHYDIGGGVLARAR